MKGKVMTKEYFKDSTLEEWILSLPEGDTLKRGEHCLYSMKTGEFFIWNE